MADIQDEEEIKLEMKMLEDVERNIEHTKKKIKV